MKRRSFFKALAAFCVLPQLPTGGWVPVQLVPFWTQTKRGTFCYDQAYVDALNAADMSGIQKALQSESEMHRLFFKQ